MTAQDQLAELLLRWEELRRHGEHPSLDDLCRQSPELLEPLRKKIKALAAIDKVLQGPAENLSSDNRQKAPAHLVDSATEFLQALRRYELLGPAQLDEIGRKVAGRDLDARALAKALVQQGWLSAFQANRVAQGNAGELVLGTYVILDRIGEGGMGQVLKARHRKLDRIAAVKVIRRERLATQDAIKRFLREMRAMAKLSHPNVVLVFDADEVDGTHYFAMEYIEGMDMARLVKERGPLPVAQACDYIRQAALGLQHAHENGLVHRDIKPHNLLVTRKGSVVKILDMGLALLHSTGNRVGTATMTQENAVMGTPDYLAPEQSLNAHMVDIRADIYSLGCTLWYLLTARVLFPGGTLTQKLLAHQLQEPESIEKLRPEVSHGVAALVRKLIAKGCSRYSIRDFHGIALQSAARAALLVLKK